MENDNHREKAARQKSIKAIISFFCSLGKDLSLEIKSVEKSIYELPTLSPNPFPIAV